jgi:hypothetical protein
VGIFGFFSNLTPMAAAEKLRLRTLSNETSPRELMFINRTSISAEQYLNERKLLRIGLMESAVAYFYRQNHRIEISDCLTCLEEMLLQHLVTHSLNDTNAGRVLHAQAEREYFIQKPDELALRFWENLNQESPRLIDEAAALLLTEIGHEILRDTLEAAHEVTNKLSS